MTQLLVDNLRSFAKNHGLQISLSPYVNNNNHGVQEDLHCIDIGDDVDTNTHNAKIQSHKFVKRKGQPMAKRFRSTSERLARKKP